MYGGTTKIPAIIDMMKKDDASSDSIEAMEGMFKEILDILGSSKEIVEKQVNLNKTDFSPVD